VAEKYHSAFGRADEDHGDEEDPWDQASTISTSWTMLILGVCC